MNKAIQYTGGTAILYPMVGEMFGDCSVASRESEPICKYCGQKNDQAGRADCRFCGAPLPYPVVEDDK